MQTDTDDRPIVVTGEALIDLVLTPEGGLSGHPGGGPYNVARTIARLDQPVVYLGRISTDPLGDRLRRVLASDGVRVGSVVATDALTTLAIAQVDGAGVAQYRFYDVGTSAAGLTLEEATAALPERIGGFYVGTLGPVLEPLATTLEAVVARLDDDALVALDPNYRPSTIDDAAAYRGRLRRLLNRTDVIKASEEDLAWLAPSDDPVTAARTLHASDHAVALVTLGAAGALMVTASDMVEVQAPAIDVVDTIGAGDAFMGSFLAGWHARGLGREGLVQLAEVAETVDFACTVAAITCSRVGPHRRVSVNSNSNRTPSGSIAESRLSRDPQRRSNRPGGPRPPGETALAARITRAATRPPTPAETATPSTKRRRRQRRAARNVSQARAR